MNKRHGWILIIINLMMIGQLHALGWNEKLSFEGGNFSLADDFILALDPMRTAVKYNLTCHVKQIEGHRNKRPEIQISVRKHLPSLYLFVDSKPILERSSVSINPKGSIIQFLNISQAADHIIFSSKTSDVTLKLYHCKAEER